MNKLIAFILLVFIMACAPREKLEKRRIEKIVEQKIKEQAGVKPVKWQRALTDIINQDTINGQYRIVLDTTINLYQVLNDTYTVSCSVAVYDHEGRPIDVEKNNRKVVSYDDIQSMKDTLISETTEAYNELKKFLEERPDYEFKYLELYK